MLQQENSELKARLTKMTKTISRLETKLSGNKENQVLAGKNIATPAEPLLRPSYSRTSVKSTKSAAPITTTKREPSKAPATPLTSRNSKQ